MYAIYLDCFMISFKYFFLTYIKNTHWNSYSNFCIISSKNKYTWFNFTQGIWSDFHKFWTCVTFRVEKINESNRSRPNTCIGVERHTGGSFNYNMAKIVPNSFTKQWDPSEVSFLNRSLHDGWCYIDPKLARIFGEAIARKGLKFLTTF